MHRAAYHFLKALHIPSLMKTKRMLRAEEESESDEEDGDEEEDDINVSTDIEASADDVEAMASTTVTDFEPGDVLGKLLALVNQVRMSSEGVRDYLLHACVVYQLKPLQLLLWVRTRWGSMSNCLESTLAIQKVSLCCNISILTSLFVSRLSITFVSLPMLMKICHPSKIRNGPTIDSLPLNGNSSNLFITVSRYVMLFYLTAPSDPVRKAGCKTAQ